MPGDRRGRRGMLVDCHCGLGKYGANPHQVAIRTRYRHMNERDRIQLAAQLMNINQHIEEEIIEEDLQQLIDDTEPQGEDFAVEDQENFEHDVHARSDYGPSEDSDVGEDWKDINTPPPSPPPSPPPPGRPPTPPPDDDEPEDDFARITAEDYREYDRWFGEDQHELEDIVLEILTEEEMDTIKMSAIRLFGHISEGNYDRIRYSFREKIAFLSVYRTTRKLALLSGITPLSCDCCVNVCHAFTGEYADDDQCHFCKSPRYNEDGTPQKTFEYLPMNPRLKGFFKNPEMINKMYFRADYEQVDGDMDEYLDGTLYKRLRQTNIVVEGEDLGIPYFHGSRDVAYAVMMDGVTLFEQAHQETSTCWPIMAINLNLPASEHVKLCNLIPLGVIPGPKQPKDFNSFLEPFVEEALEQARGLETYDASRGRHFTLRAHPIIISGDMQAMKHAMEMKGPNGKLPCRACESPGIYLNASKTYYIPLANPHDNPDAIPNDRIHPDAQPGMHSSLDPENLILRTSDRIAEQLGKMDNALLDRIPSISRPDSYPHEFLHLFLLNHGPELVSLWAGIYRLGENDEFVFAEGVWPTVGLETVEASNTIAAKIVRRLPNIATCWRLYCGESWCFWLVYVGPIVLRGRLLQKYYDHYMELVNILKCLLSPTNKTARIEQLRGEIVHYVEKFEELYYQYKYERMSVCKLTLHSLLHVADDVLRCGPVWVAWSFPIERYCREVTFCAKSKVLPYMSINKHVLHMAQIASIAGQFQPIRKALLFGKNDAPAPISRMECVYPQYEEHNIILCFPCLRAFFLQNTIRKHLAWFFYTNYPHQTYSAWLDFIPEQCKRWGKLRIGDGGDSIRAAIACNESSIYSKRDASFIHYKFKKDANEDDPNAPIRMVDAIAYGRLEFILAITLPDGDEESRDFLQDTPVFHILAYITEAKDIDWDHIPTFTKFGGSFILDITSVRHIAARVFTKGRRAAGEWGIIDCAEKLADTSFDVDEHGSDDEERWRN